MIIMKFNKGLNLYIIALIVSFLFLFSGIAYSCQKDSLRVPMGQKNTNNRQEGLMEITRDIEQYRKWQQEGVVVEIHAGNQLDPEVIKGKIRLITNVATGYPIIWLEGHDFGIYLKDIIRVVLPNGQALAVKDQDLIKSASKWRSLQRSGLIISGNTEIFPRIPEQRKETLKQYVYPIAVANLPNGGIVVADSNPSFTYGAGITMPDSSFIPLLDEDGQPLTKEIVKKMTTDDLGYIYVATASSKQTGMGKIRKYSQDGALLGGYDVSYGSCRKAGYGINIQGMVVFENKLYYTIADFRELRALDLSSGKEKIFGGPEINGSFLETRSMDLSIDKERRTVLIIDSGYADFQAGGMASGNTPMRIRKFSIDTEEYGKPQELPGMFATGGLSIDDGIVYISDRERNMVHVYSILEGYQGYIPTFREVTSIATGNKGELIIGRSGGFDVISQEAIAQLLVRVSNGGASVLSANLPIKALPSPNPINPNVSCGTICENGHEGSYTALDEQLQRQFDKLRNVYNNQVPSQVKKAVSEHFGVSMHDRIVANEKLTEIETDLANVFSGYLSQEEFIMLQSIRNIIKKTDTYKRAVQNTGKGIEIFFTRPETGTELFWHGNNYAAGHFNKVGTRIHISLPLAIRDAHEMVLSRSGGFAVLYNVVSAAVGQHELIHISENRHDWNLDSIIKAISERDIKRKQIKDPSIATFDLPDGSRLEMATISEYNKPVENMDRLHQITQEDGWHGIAVSVDNLPKDLLELFAATKIDAEGKVSMLDILRMSTDEIIFAPHLIMYNQTGEKMMYSVGEMVLNPFELYDSSIRPGKRILFVGTLIPSDAIRTGEQIYTRNIVEISHYIARAIGRRITQQLVMEGNIGNDYLHNNNLLDRNSWAMERQFLLAFSEILTQNKPEHKELIAQITQGHKIDDIVRLNLQGQFLHESEMMIRSSNETLGIPLDYMNIPQDVVNKIMAGVVSEPAAPISAAVLEKEIGAHQTVTKYRGEKKEGDSIKRDRAFGNTGLRFFPIGLGTVWIGREWPVGNLDYTDPSSEEIKLHLDKAFETMGNKDGMIMLDTSAAYGYTEERIGHYFQKRPYLLQKAFIATKWGEEFDVSTGKSTYDYSRNNLISSVNRSISRLNKIDLLYIHGTGTPDEVLGVLSNKEVIAEMNTMKKENYGGIRYLGVSISNPDVFEKAVQENLIQGFDVVQVAIKVYRSKRDLLQKLYHRGVAIVINSPARGSKDVDPKEVVYRDLLSDESVSMVLTGTMHHLEETV